MASLKQHKHNWYMKNRKILLLKFKEYRKNNHERLTEYDRLRYKRDGVKIKMRQRRYYLNNKEKINKQNMKNYERNKDYLKSKFKEYRIRNKDRIRGLYNKYRLNNPEKMLEYNKLCLNKQMESLGFNIREYRWSLQSWSDSIKKRDDYKCQICGFSTKLNAHHIFHRSLYPKLALNLNNGITLCKIHHDEVHNKNLGAGLGRRF